MEPDSIQIISDTITYYDTIQVHLIENVALSDSSKSFIGTLAKGSSNNISDYTIPGISILIAIGALILSGMAYYNSSKHNLISVMPILIFRETTSHRTGKITLYIANKGMGPLTFSRFEMRYEGITYYKMFDVFKVIRDKFDYKMDDFSKKRSYVNPLKDHSLKAADTKNLINYQLKGKTELQSKTFYSEFKKIIFIYSYHDLYKKTESSNYQFTN